MTTSRDTSRSETKLDVIIVGAGFAGLYMLHRLRGLGFSTRVYEAEADIGGTWYMNRYPGARCDVESMQYSYSFSNDLQQEWNWSEKFATQPEILSYINHVADRFDLRKDVQLETRIASARFDATANEWQLVTEDGDTIRAKFCIMATGCLSAARLPDIPGLGSFAGDLYHTGDWPKNEPDLSGKSVGVIGTGSSGIQAIPEIAKRCGHLFVFQRTPTFSVPARNAALSAEEINHWKSSYAELRAKAREVSQTGSLFKVPKKSAMDVSAAEREDLYQESWRVGGPNFAYTFNDLILDERSNATAADFVRARIRETVNDPVVAASLLPSGYPIFAKRICVDTDYYETFNRPNVTLVDLRKSPISELTPAGLQTTEHHYDLDVVVLATGFDAITGALSRIDVEGPDGTMLKDKWAASPSAYLGLMTSGFPNMFTITGPGSPSVLSNVIVSIEQHVDWISTCLETLREQGVTRIEPTEQAEDDWMSGVKEAADATLYPRAASWYMGANVPGKPRVFMPYVGGVNKYRRVIEAVAANGYPGFDLNRE